MLYGTLQPCGMCTMASIWSKLHCVVYGAGREGVHRMYFGARHVDTLVFIGEACRGDVSISDGVLRKDCAQPYRPPNYVPENDQGDISAWRS